MNMNYDDLSDHMVKAYNEGWNEALYMILEKCRHNPGLKLDELLKQIEYMGKA